MSHYRVQPPIDYRHVQQVLYPGFEKALVPAHYSNYRRTRTQIALQWFHHIFFGASTPT